MRLRVGFVLCLFSILSILGCRKALAPNIDRNKPPETWITAAPFDTITLAKGETPPIGTIPVRFHVYWAGSDQDGAVRGYYWAVTETVVTVRRLPGPRASDYRFTTRSDSIFIFNVAEDVPDRLHAFYIYAVDDQGKPDPTPARFVFNALDRFPPLPVFDEAYGIGTTYFFDAGGVLRSEVRRFDISDTLTGGSGSRAPKDTVPSNSRLKFRFHGEITVAGSVIKGFRYKLDEAQLQPEDPDSLYQKNVVEYHVPPAEADPDRLGADTVAVASGTKVFTLRAVDQANGSRDRTKRFQLNFSPDTWFAGPDTNLAVGGPWQTNSLGERFVLYVPNTPDKLPVGGVPGTMIHRDSTLIMPANRPARRTFLEVWKDTLFLRREDDTVHLGSWVIFHNGGFDKDSPYTVRVVDGIQNLQPNFPGGPVLTKSTQPLGSPIGFRANVSTLLFPNGPLGTSAQSQLFPFYDPNDVFNFQRIGYYHPVTGAGRAYVLFRSEDGDGARDNRVDEPRRIVEFPRNDAERALRPLVLTFNVGFPPVFLTHLPTGQINPVFRPSITAVDTFTSRTWDLRLPNDDRDPWTSGSRIGAPSETKVSRIRIMITGKDTTGADLVYIERTPSGARQDYPSQTDINYLVPCHLGTGPVTLTIELCDCAVCEGSLAGEGRCITRDFAVYYKRPSSASVGCGAVGPGALGSVSRGEP